MLHVTISPSVVPVSSSGRPGPGEDADSRCSGAAAEAAGAAATTVTRAAFPHTATVRHVPHPDFCSFAAHTGVTHHCM